MGGRGDVVVDVLFGFWLLFLVNLKEVGMCFDLIVLAIFWGEDGGRFYRWLIDMSGIT